MNLKELLFKKLKEAIGEKERIKREEPDNRIAWNWWDGYSTAIKEIMIELEG